MHREPVLLMALKIMLHAKLCLSVIKHLIGCVGIRKGCARHCLVEGRGGKLGQVRLNELFNHTACFWLYRVL